MVSFSGRVLVGMRIQATFGIGIRVSLKDNRDVLQSSTD